MNYKDIAVKNEQRLKQENERLKTLLFNTLIMLEDVGHIYPSDKADFIRELGMTEKEYKEIME